jgi:hypothetical protein
MAPRLKLLQLMSKFAGAKLRSECSVELVVNSTFLCGEKIDEGK